MPPPSSNVGAAAPMITGQRYGFRQPFHLEVAPIYMVSLTTSPNSWPLNEGSTPVVAHSTG